MDFQLLSKELDQFLSSNWKDYKRLVLTDLSDKNGITKETKVKDSKKKEKPQKRTDLKTYLNYLPFSLIFIIITIREDKYFKLNYTKIRKIHRLKCIKRNSLSVIFSLLELAQYPQHSLRDEDMFLLFSKHSFQLIHRPL